MIKNINNNIQYVGQQCSDQLVESDMRAEGTITNLTTTNDPSLFSRAFSYVSSFVNLNYVAEKEQKSINNRSIKNAEVEMPLNLKFKLEPELINAIKQEELAKVESLIKSGINPNGFVQSGYYCRSPLYQAAEAGNVEITKMLIEYGADIDGGIKRRNLGNGISLYNEQTPISIAAANDHTEIVELLLKLGALQHPLNCGQNHPLCLAAFYGNIRTVRLLLERGVNLSDFPAGDKHPTTIAKLHGHNDVVALLDSLDPEYIYMKKVFHSLPELGSMKH